MKKLTLLSLIVTSLLLLIGCNAKNLVSHQLDTQLPKLNDVKARASSTSIGFEWKPLNEGLDGVNIYRTGANQYAKSATKQLMKVATISNPYATHFVDKDLRQNSAYTYTFTTVKAGYESEHGNIIEIHTKPPLPQVGFFQGAQKSKTVIKLIWRPHDDIRVKMYKIERSVNGENWKWVKSIHSRMMVEYIDTYVKSGSRHQYRIIAVGFDDSFSKPSKVITINAR